jgi:hypothetical protein
MSSYLCNPTDAISCLNKCRRDRQYGRQAIYAMVKVVLNPDNEIIAHEDDWKRMLAGYKIVSMRIRLNNDRYVR